MNTPVRWADLAGHNGETVRDTLACEGCGYAVCSCPEDLEGWVRVVEDHEVFSYQSYRKGGAIVWNYSYDPEVWRWGYTPDGGCVCCTREDAKATKEEAMVAALELYARVELGI
jgi:hypothetical protein